jgi:MFS family permease
LIELSSELKYATGNTEHFNGQYCSKDMLHETIFKDRINLVKYGCASLNKFLISRTAWVLCVTSIIIYLFAAYLAYLNRFVILPEDWGPSYSILVSQLPALAVLLLGLLIILRVEETKYGWVWLGLGVCFGAIVPFGQSYAIYALMVSPNAPPLGWLAVYLTGIAWVIGLSLLPLVLLLFPTGKPPTPRWGLLIWIIGIALLLIMATSWALPENGFVPIENPDRLASPFDEKFQTIGNLTITIIFLTIPLSALSLIHRYILAVREVRQQLKWFAFGAVLFCLVIASDFVYTAPGFWEPMKEALGFVILPVTVGIAILRYRLWDIDLIIRKTLQYTIITVLLTLVYFGSVLVLQNLVETISGAQSPIVIVISTLAIAALFNPLRLRTQDFIDRRFYRKKYDAERALAQFAAEARDEVDMDKLTTALMNVVEETLQPVMASLWLKRP